MIDYYSHVSALNVCLGALKNAPPPDQSNPKAPLEALHATQRQRGSAILGTLVDHLLQYSQSRTSVEIEILRQAASLFQDGRAILDQFNAVLPSLEAGMTTPTASGVLPAFNAALAKIPGVVASVQSLQAKFATFQMNFRGNWMAAVGQQRDAPIPQWAWRDVFLSRLTTAFVANTQALATTPRQRAFALGTLAGAAGNLLGSGYLNAVVGGPRRSHQLRHRLAAYSVGAWFRDNEPQYAGTLASIRHDLSFGQSATPVLPSDIKTLADEALHKTYPTGTAALPDLDLGYSHLMEHLKLLGEFSVPAAPAPLANNFMAKLVALNITPGTIAPQDDPPDPSDPPETTVTGGVQPGPHQSTKTVCEQIWEDIGIALLAVAAFFGAKQTINQTQKAIPGNVSTTSELVTLSNTPDVLSQVNSLYGAALLGWQCLATARAALVMRGWLYPDPDDLDNPTFQQFLSIPMSSQFPLLPMPNSDDGTVWPTSAVETPTTSPSPFAAGASPLAFLTGDPTSSVIELSPILWVDMIEHPGGSQRLSANLDLDADRGYLSPCWELEPGSSITSLPVQTIALGFTSI